MDDFAGVGSSPRKFAITTAMKILRSRLDEPGPEERLWLAVIEHAIRDAYGPTSKSDERRQEARDWIDSDHFEEIAIAIGLNPRWARDKIHRVMEIPVYEERAPRRLADRAAARPPVSLVPGGAAGPRESV